MHRTRAWLGGVVVAALSTAAAVVVPAEPAMAAAFVNGTATAISQAMVVSPHTGGFAYTATIGSSVADYRGTLAQAESQSLDLGLLGTAVTAEQCDGSAPPIQPDQLPQPLIAESDKGNVNKSQDQEGLSNSGVLAASGHETVSATTVPASTATFDGGIINIPGVLEASGMSSNSSAKLIPGKARIATAEATVGKLSLGGGAVVLDNMHWTATQRTGAGATSSAAFTIGGVTIAGQSQSLRADQAGSVVDAINSALAQTGLHLDLPTAHKAADGSLVIPPLQVGIDNSSVGATVLDPITTGAQPVTQQLEQAVLGISCKFGSAFVVESILLGAIDGTGGLDLRFGGAQAGTNDTTYADPFGAALTPGFASSATISSSTLTTPGRTVPGLPGTPAVGATGTAPQLAPQANVSKSCATTSPAHWPSCSNGAAIAAGLIGLAAVLGVGGADWLVTRRRRRLPQFDW